MKTRQFVTVLFVMCLSWSAYAAESDTDKISMEFRGARLGQILDYLSAEAGLIIVNPVELPKPITLVAKQKLSIEEAIDALSGVLYDEGYTTLVRGKTLRVVPLATAKRLNLPVQLGANPENIPENDQMVTQILPVQFAKVKDLIENLQPLLDANSATLSANESSNSLILTATQASVRRIASIIQAIDGSVTGVQSVQVFHLFNADATSVAKVINDVYGQSGSSNNQQQGGWWGRRGRNGGGNNQQQSEEPIGSEVVAAADTGTNSVVVRASPSTLTSLANVIKDMDVDNATRESVFLYKVKNGKATEIADALNNLFSATQSTTNRNGQNNQNRRAQQNGNNNTATTDAAALDLSTQVRVVPDETSNSVLVLSPERNFPLLEDLLAKLDQAQRQVLVRVLVAEVTAEEGVDIGVELQGVNPASETDSSRVFSDFNLFNSTLGLNGFIMENDNFHAAISALSTKTQFDVLSRPYILTTDNREAVVNVSQEVPVITGSRTDQDNNVVTTFDRRDVGIILTVTPQINGEGRVVLDVAQELSALTELGIPVAPDVESPIIRKRSMTTRVAVENGQTVVIGGLVMDSSTSTNRKVPILGDIPLLGMLFRRKVVSKSNTELLVFLTPQVVTSPEDLADLSSQLRREMSRLDAAVVPHVLSEHINKLMKLDLNQPLAPTKYMSVPVQEGNK